MAHHASKAQTKPKNPWLMRNIVLKFLNVHFHQFGVYFLLQIDPRQIFSCPPYNPTIKLYTSLVNSWKPANFSLRYPWLGVMFLFTTDRGYHITLYRVKLPRIPRFYFAKIPWDGWKFKLPRIPRFYGKIKPWDGWKFKLPGIPRFFGKIKPWPSWKFKLPRWSGFYFAKKPWDAWKFKLPPISRYFGKIKPWDAWKFKLPCIPRVS